MQQTSEVRELTDAELESVNGGKGDLLGAIVGVVLEGVVAPIYLAVVSPPIHL